MRELAEGSFEGSELVLMSAGEEVSKEWAKSAVAEGAVVIDNSSAWRMTEGVPLVVPEVNDQDLTEMNGIVANPNCCTIALVLALAAVRDRVGLKRVVVATYQSASGAGRELVEEMERQNGEIVRGEAVSVKVYSRQLAGNVVPGGWKMGEAGENEEEIKIRQETRKILHLPNLSVGVTCVRVPVKVGHGEAVWVETEKETSAEEVEEWLGKQAGVRVVKAGDYATPLEVAGKDEVVVSRVRRDSSVEHGIAMWVVSDNLRKGAALNAVQIAERLVVTGRIGKI